MQNDEARMTNDEETLTLRHSSFVLRHWFPHISLSGRDGAVRRPGAQSWTPLRSARRRGRPSSRDVDGLVLLPKEGGHASDSRKPDADSRALLMVRFLALRNRPLVVPASAGESAYNAA